MQYVISLNIMNHYKQELENINLNVMLSYYLFEYYTLFFYKLNFLVLVFMCLLFRIHQLVNNRKSTPNKLRPHNKIISLHTIKYIQIAPQFQTQKCRPEPQELEKQKLKANKLWLFLVFFVFVFAFLMLSWCGPWSLIIPVQKPQKKEWLSISVPRKETNWSSISDVVQSLVQSLWAGKCGNQNTRLTTDVVVLWKFAFD